VRFRTFPENSRALAGEALTGVLREGALIVTEVGVLKPAPFMEFDPPSAERFAEATLKRL
jgi:hypothetical protein